MLFHTLEQLDMWNIFSVIDGTDRRVYVVFVRGCNFRFHLCEKLCVKSKTLKFDYSSFSYLDVADWCLDVAAAAFKCDFATIAVAVDVGKNCRWWREEMLKMFLIISKANGRDEDNNVADDDEHI